MRAHAGRADNSKRGAAAIALGGGKMWFVWTPQRVRIVIYFLAGYIALC
jgi:hypothetical protein